MNEKSFELRLKIYGGLSLALMLTNCQKSSRTLGNKLSHSNFGFLNFEIKILNSFITEVPSVAVFYMSVCLLQSAIGHTLQNIDTYEKFRKN